MFILDRIGLNETLPKPAVQRSAKGLFSIPELLWIVFLLGAICIDECSPDGKYIQLANTSAIKDVDLSGWQLVQSVDDAPEISFVMPNNFILAKRKTIRIYARGQGNERPSFELVSTNFSTWGVGLTVVTRLLNNNNDEKSLHIQRTAQ